jgi:hypothetical protein
MANLKLTKAKMQGALNALLAEGRIASEGATMNRIHRMVEGAAAPPPQRAAAGGKKRDRAGKGKSAHKDSGASTGKGARTRTRRAVQAPAPEASAAEHLSGLHPLQIDMGDDGRVRLTRNGAAPFALLTPDEHRRLHAFLDRMEPVWAAP